jgi:putative cell wall-binding protein
VNHTRGLRARGLAAAALAAAAIGLVGIAAPGQAATTVTTGRIAGANRYETAAKVATTGYPSGADTVLVASGRSYPDALSGAALAGRTGAPILLTDPASLPKETSDAITTLKATKAVILGGTVAVSKAVEDAIAAKSVAVTRVSGQDRYETAAKVASQIGAANVGTIATKKAAFIATGNGFADALAGSPLAAAGSGGQLPILLVDSGVPASTKQALTDLGIKQTIILGGTGVVSASVATQLETITGNAPQRIAGADRYATAAEAAKRALADFAFDKTKVMLAGTARDASGADDDFPDALAAGPLGGKTKTPILLSDPNTLSSATQTYLKDHNADVATITAVGGTSALSDDVVSAAKTAATPLGTQSITVTPADESFMTNSTQSSRTYTASGITGSVDIVLVSCDNVTGTSFANTNANTVADGTSGASSATAPDKADTPAAITQTNGSPASPPAGTDYAKDVAATDGKVTFVVSGSATVTCVVPVVFVDSTDDDALNVPSGGSTPTEVYGLGGKVNFTPATAAGGSIPDLTVQSATPSGDRFVACTAAGPTQTCSTFFYDSGDTYQLGGVASTMTEFESRISPDDVVNGTYAQTGVSTFNLKTDAGPAAPTNVSAANSGTTTKQVTVTWTPPQTAGVTAYKVYRATGGTPAATPVGSVDCSSAGTYTAITPTPVAGTPNALGTTRSYADSAVTSGTTYCYKVQSVDKNGDVGDTLSDPAGVTVS